MLWKNEKLCLPKTTGMENQTNFQNMPDPKKKEFGKAYPLKSNKMYVDQGSITIHACVHIFLFFQFLPVCTTSLGSLWVLTSPAVVQKQVIKL